MQCIESNMIVIGIAACNKTTGYPGSKLGTRENHYVIPILFVRSNTIYGRPTGIMLG